MVSNRVMFPFIFFCSDLIDYSHVVFSYSAWWRLKRFIWECSSEKIIITCDHLQIRENYQWMSSFLVKLLPKDSTSQKMNSAAGMTLGFHSSEVGREQLHMLFLVSRSNIAWCWKTAHECTTSWSTYAPFWIDSSVTSSLLAKLQHSSVSIVFFCSHAGLCF